MTIIANAVIAMRPLVTYITVAIIVVIPSPSATSFVSPSVHNTLLTSVYAYSIKTADVDGYK